MAAIDKMYVHSYYDYDYLRKWAFAYYPKLLFYMPNISISLNEYLTNRQEWLKIYKQRIKKDIARLGDYKTRQGAIINLWNYYKETADYDCPMSQLEEEVDYCFKQKEKIQAGDFALEDDYEFLVMNTPLKVDRKLLWICPVPCVREYLEKQCGYKTRWYHKLFWRGKKHF